MYKHLIDFPSAGSNNVVVINFAGPDQPQKSDKRMVRINKAFKKRGSSIATSYAKRLTHVTGVNSYICDLNRFIPQGVFDFGDITENYQYDYQCMLMNNAVQRYHESLDKRDSEFDERRKKLIEENRKEQEEKRKVAEAGGVWEPVIPKPPKDAESDVDEPAIGEADEGVVDDGYDETFEDPSQKWCVLVLIKNEVGDDGCDCMAVLDVFKSENKAQVHAQLLQKQYPKYDYIPTRMYEWIDLDSEVYALGVKYNHEGLASNVDNQRHQHEVISQMKLEAGDQT